MPRPLTKYRFRFSTPLSPYANVELEFDAVGRSMCRAKNRAYQELESRVRENPDLPQGRTWKLEQVTPLGLVQY